MANVPVTTALTRLNLSDMSINERGQVILNHPALATAIQSGDLSAIAHPGDAASDNGCGNNVSCAGHQFGSQLADPAAITAARTSPLGR